MKISEWLLQENKTQAQLARMMGTYPVKVHRILQGYKPKENEMQKIFEITGGAVTANDFYNLPNGDAA